MSLHLKDGAGTLEKALDILDVIAANPTGLSQADLTTKLALPRATLYRLLATLIERGLIRRDPLRRVYCLGLRCLEMARQTSAMPELVAAASAEMHALRDLSGETTYLSILEGLDVVILDRVDGVHPIRSSAALGQRQSVYFTSQGKAILAAMNSSLRESLINKMPMRATTSKTICDWRHLQTELTFAATQGYAVDRTDAEMLCISASIVDTQGKVRGAISVVGSSHRLNEARMTWLGSELTESGRRIGAQLVVERSGGLIESVIPVEGLTAGDGASPCWNSNEFCLYWLDKKSSTVHISNGGHDNRWLQIDSPVAAMLVLETGVLLALENEVRLIDSNRTALPTPTWSIPKICALCTNSLHEIWFAAKRGPSEWQVGRVDSNLKQEPYWIVNEPVNDLCWSLDNRVLYATAPQSGSLLMFIPEYPQVRRLASVPLGAGQLSGLAVDARGGIWVALKNGWGVLRLTPDGNIDRTLGLPVPCPTGVALSDPRERCLYVTTTRDQLSESVLEKAPYSGRLLKVFM